MAPVLLDQLPPALKDRNAGRTTIKKVRIESREDSSGQPALFVVLVLSDPPEGAETWPVDDLWELRRMARELVTKIDPELAVPWFVSFEPEQPDLLDPDDEAVEIGDSVDVGESVDVDVTGTGDGRLT